MLHHTAVAARNHIKEETNRFQRDSKPLTFEEIAKLLISKVLTEDNLLLAENRGAFTISVLPLKYWALKENLDLWQRTVYDEIERRGFEPQVISELDLKCEDRMEYYVGIQWRKI